MKSLKKKNILDNPVDIEEEDVGRRNAILCSVRNPRQSVQMQGSRSNVRVYCIPGGCGGGMAGGCSCLVFSPS